MTRLVVTEAAIDALSFAALDRFHKGTLYTSTGGGMSPESEANLKRVMMQVAAQPEARLVVAVDNDLQGIVMPGNSLRWRRTSVSGLGGYLRKGRERTGTRS
ncbi:toprim domain-containing protein [Komagataeibacter rhaeticus]|nr:toprim domain-containing protein [Komagataeibacter rhaeticus]